MPTYNVILTQWHKQEATVEVHAATADDARLMGLDKMYNPETSWTVIQSKELKAKVKFK